MSRRSSHNDEVAAGRRKFLGFGMAAAAGVLTWRSRPANAANLPHLSPEDPTAKALQYSEDAETVTSSARKAGATCANCNFYQGEPDAAYGSCQLFPGKAVHAKGWCLSHVAKT